MKDIKPVLKIILCLLIMVPGALVTHWLSEGTANTWIFNPKYMTMITDLVSHSYKNTETFQDLVDNENLYDAYIGKDVCITYLTVHEFLNHDPTEKSDNACIIARTAGSQWIRKKGFDEIIYLFMESSPELAKLEEGDVIIFHGTLDRASDPNDVKLAFGELLYVFKGGVFCDG